MTASTVLITGASTGIGAVYADRFARRGHDLVIVARDQAKLETLAAHLRQDYGVNVDVLPADLTQSSDLERVEKRLQEDARIDTLINNAGIAQTGKFVEQTPDSIGKLIALNITALTRLANAVTPRLVKEGKGAIVNVSSVVGLAPEYQMTVYGATKAFVLFLSQGMDQELSSKGIYVQALLPAGTYTEIWERAGIDISNSSPMMEVNELVDAALVGFDRRELVTIPPLHNDASWDTLDKSRQELLSHIKMSEAAVRYKTA
ncbi:short-chain dehydrogenase/reductase SDR [Dickeya chrysanthemi Ech1591]|uniref:Short-chain dehydrogenase/reductase SDR n=1 Tax=Dickeya chrysanthemi (strain Ech1591) TaxID=561229 RepID=C6CHK4_DICC1|nr:SDR family oxidoreductase [Dickeya chrysanthemi]ACT06905.1 short-chain dehydrogenase/reductase SDR [Dickeya chrysanthemi Ech1591]